MPLLDHFRGPLFSRRHWTAFHSAWATYISEDLNERLPPDFFAEPTAQFGIEIDVATWKETMSPASTPAEPIEAWLPSAPQMTVPFTLTTDVVEISVFHNEGGLILAGAIELVSPSNKDRHEAREAFVSKCAAYLHQSVGVAIVDIVTGRRANLHHQLLNRVTPEQSPGSGAELYASAYRPVGRNGQTSLEIWHEPLSIGGRLPTVPLWLRAGPCLPVDLEATYERTVQKQRILTNGV